MEIQLQELIAQIKKDGVQAAENEATAIVNDAKAQAEKILADAKAKAEDILANAKSENERMVKSGEYAIRQAGRNLLLSFRESVARELKVLVGETVTDVYHAETFAGLVAKAVEGFAAKPETENIAVILNSDDVQLLEQTVLSGLKDKLGKGITLKANDTFDGGFRIAVNENGAYYDYSAEAVADMLSNYLTPKVTALLKEAE